MNDTRRPDESTTMGDRRQVDDLLVVLNGVKQRVSPADAPVTIGRSTQNRFVVFDESVSGHHATLTVEHDAWRLVDQSRYGTFVAGERVTDLRVGSDVELRLADPSTGPALLLSPRSPSPPTLVMPLLDTTTATESADRDSKKPVFVAAAAVLVSLFGAVGVVAAVTSAVDGDRPVAVEDSPIGSPVVPDTGVHDDVQVTDEVEESGDVPDTTETDATETDPTEIPAPSDETDEPPVLVPAPIPSEEPPAPSDESSTDGGVVDGIPAEFFEDIDTAVNVVDGFWAAHWADHFTGEYVSPTVVGLYDGTLAEAPTCFGDQLEADNAFYCYEDDSVSWDLGLMTDGFAKGDSFVYLVVAHEWGHAIQARLDDTLLWNAGELQADCFAGAALFGAASDGTLNFESGDSSEITIGLAILGDDLPWTDATTHGDSFERVDAFDMGRTGGPQACLPISG